MKQRVGLARALSINPLYFCMDEPFGALDPQIREMMQIELMKLWDHGRARPWYSSPTASTRRSSCRTA